MKSNKLNAIAAALMFTGLMGAGALHAEETIGEKAAATANDAQRAVKKGAHRAEEMVCMEGDAKCLAEKAKHRAQEAGDYTKDKAKEVKNTVDSDKK